MTRDAIVDDAGVIEGRGNKATGGVTNTAILVGGHMIGLFRRSEAGSVTR